MSFKEFTLQNILGYNIYTWSVGSPEKPVLLMIHGYLEYSSRYKHMAEFLSDEYFVIGFDLPGHGLSSGRRADIESFSDFSKIIDAVLKHYKVKRCSIFAHSLGGLISYQYLQQKPEVDVLILHNPAFGFGETWMKILEFALNPFLSLLVKTNLALQIPIEIAAKNLVTDPELRKKIEKDQLISRRTTPRMIFQIANARNGFLKNPLKTHTPLILMQGLSDPVVDAKKNIDFLKDKVKELKTYEYAIHEPHHDQGHEVVWKDVKNFLKLRRS